MSLGEENTFRPKWDIPSPSKNGKVVLFLCWTLDYMSPLLHQNLITFFKKDQYMYRCDTCTKIEF